MADSLLAYADTDLIRDAVLAATNEETDPDFAIEQVQTDDPGEIFKTTVNSTVITITLAQVSTVVALFLINHNLAGATVVLANVAGLSETVAIPARTRGGLCVNAFLDLRVIANNADDDWTLTISGAAGLIAIGRILLIEDAGLVALPTNPSQRIKPERGKHTITTFSGHDIVYDKRIRQRTLQSSTMDVVEQQILETAWEASNGGILPMGLVPDPSVNDAWFAKLEFEHERQTPFLVPASFTFREVAMSPPLYDLEQAT